MNYLDIKLAADVKILAVSDIHEHSVQFFELINQFEFSDKLKLVVCGDLIDKGFGFKAFESITTKIKELSDAGFAYVIKGNHELKRIKKSKNKENFHPLLQWLDKQPISLSFLYPNGQRYTCVHAGITPDMKFSELNTDLNVCYVRYLDTGTYKHVPAKKIEIDGKVQYVPAKEPVVNWHDIYDGRFGYIISGHQSNASGPHFYNYSCDIDSAVFKTGKLTGVLFNQNGKEDIIAVYGQAYERTQVQS